MEEQTDVKRVKTSKEEEEEEKFWLDEEIAKLDDENGWKPLLQTQAKKSRALFRFIESLPPKMVLPAREDVFAAFKLCPFDKVRVVLLGQDPYHGPNQAHGLSFSVKRGVLPPPSLKNIFKEAKQDLGAQKFTFNPSRGDLTQWAEQGVLLLNTLLTVEPGKPNSHKAKGWEQFTDACIIQLARERSHLVFFLWGKPAQEKAKLLHANGCASKHLIIQSSHPSPLGANAKTLPFFGSKCFSRCNAYLKENGLEEIEWSLST